MIDDYVCPNRHPFPAVQEVRCALCSASVAVEPAAHGMELQREIERLRALLRALGVNDQEESR